MYKFLYLRRFILCKHVSCMQPIPENVFIIAACNPHRGNSMASLGVRGADKEKEKWVRGTYYVRKLHPTLQFLMWDYGSLDEQQEREYINAKMKMLNHLKDNPVEDAMVSFSW